MGTEQELPIYQEILNDIASSGVDTAADVQRYVVTPAILEMMGAVKGKSVLDLYCGAGYLSRRLAAMGADVTAVDASERLLGIAGAIDSKENQGIKYIHTDSHDLSAVDDSTFDEIVCNMGLMRVRDLNGTIAELARLVKLGGRFIFSVIHPCFNMSDACWIASDDGKTHYKAVDNYHSEVWFHSDLVTNGRSDGRKIKHRTLSSYINALSARGFNVRRVFEPVPTEETLILRPHLEVFQRVPVAMVVEAVFPYI